MMTSVPPRVACRARGDISDESCVHKLLPSLSATTSSSLYPPAHTLRPRCKKVADSCRPYKYNPTPVPHPTLLYAPSALQAVPTLTAPQLPPHTSG